MFYIYKNLKASSCKTREDADISEIQLIKQYNSNDLSTGYNMTFDKAERTTKISQKELARENGMSQATINSIILYKTYRSK